MQCPQSFLTAIRSCLRATALLIAFASASVFAAQTPDAFGVLIMAHGGSPEWNKSVASAAEPLRERFPIEIAFGMADAVTMEDAVRRLEGQGVRNIGVVRLFVSGESWYDRTRQILGLAPGAPQRSAGADHVHGDHAHHQEQSMALYRLDTKAAFALSTQGLGEAPATGTILAERASALSRAPQREDVLILAHGPGDDDENQRWLAYLDVRAQAGAALQASSGRDAARRLARQAQGGRSPRPRVREACH